ncbi:MAG: SAM-dependent methyltransferase [Chloroflexi bacterium]|jgi:hypothetical protein|nr:hypothetical protein [Anaerolineaceae bacterium]NLI44832.1 SAM-dependent methyltransferase [Chloroflexota bacterium]HOE35701.1 hypothetical protein [Anaerolineaceae bacterium]HOT26268.1 hypothetical protein [Anaerolineaceae bacterium]HQH58207.1 hypothetical protein [Anaerolineaceae bacterium]
MVEKSGASFRDPSGFIFIRDAVVYRQVNLAGRESYDALMQSGLYERLTKAKALVSHQEVPLTFAPTAELAYKVIRPEPIPFISYPYEWCFDQLKDAAILTLSIARRALEYGLSLKDASAYNVQFLAGKPIFIDTLSFEPYQEGLPWVAYRQFCQHFLAPLALMAHKDIRLSQLLRVYIDGIPLDLASRLLPARSRLNFGLLSHIHLHARSQQKYAGKQVSRNALEGKVSLPALRGLLENLLTTVRGLHLRSANTEWGNYYEENNYTEAAFAAKRNLVKDYLLAVNPRSVWDLGANTGEFSRAASEMGILTAAFDIDHSAVQQNYRMVKQNSEKSLLPLWIDLTNPSPALGWDSRERASLRERGPVDLIMALALIHHLAIANNVPLERAAASFADMARHLIIEFVPKTDSQVQRLLATRADIFPDYNRDGFEQAFTRHFIIHKAEPIPGSQRILYLMERRAD